MPKFRFTLVLRDYSEITSELEDKVYNTGCGDALLKCISGQVMLDFEREGKTKELTILNTKATLIWNGLEVK